MEKTDNSIIRIAIVGPESTGKSDLAKDLAIHYNTCYVEEYAREYINKLNRPYTIDDIIAISKGQMELEDKMAAKANKILFCDTNLVVTKIWAEHAYKQCPEWISVNLKKRQYALHLLTNIDMPWMPDPQREHPYLREYLFEKYQRELDNEKVAYTIISGIGNERISQAIKAIDTLLYPLTGLP
ncbi:MAG TPA: AAA family ATPase [Bacteroidia bacterium]|nr:AAA family ATPase [Bacteroidia bacterium]